MIKKLRRSFIRVTMLSAALVLILLMGLVNILNYAQRSSADQDILTFLAENGGRIPDGKDLRGKHGQPLPTDLLNEARYFSVTLSSEGWLLNFNNAQAPWIISDTAAEMARAVQLTGKTSGRYGDNQFTSIQFSYGVTYYFLTWSQNMDAMHSFFVNSIIVTALGLVGLFFLAWALSGRAIRPIAESYEKQKSFITNAGHELKTPLAVIESCTEVLELENGENHWTESIHGQVARLSTLTADLIALSRMDEDSAKPALTELNISDVISDALDPYILLAQQNGLTLTADIEPAVTIRSNRDTLEKICGILADNAVKYTSNGSDIRFSLTREGGHICLHAENPASDLTPGKQEKLFDRFYRADESRSSQTPGYGLGLPLARSLAESIGAGISARSPDGKRIIFTVQFT